MSFEQGNIQRGKEKRKKYVGNSKKNGKMKGKSSLRVERMQRDVNKGEKFA